MKNIVDADANGTPSTGDSQQVLQHLQMEDMHYSNLMNMEQLIWFLEMNIVQALYIEKIY